MNAFLMRMGEMSVPETSDFDVFGFVFRVAIWLAAFVLIAGGLYFCVWLACLPLRRRQSATLVLQIIENGLGRGRSPEASLRGVAETRDPVLGLSFHLLVGWLERGLSLPEALDKVPGLLPRRVVALLQAGCAIGAPAKVVPACRAQMQSSVTEKQVAYDGLWYFVLGIWPAYLGVVAMTLVFVLPKFEEIFKDMSDGLTPFPTALRWVSVAFPYLIWVESVLVGLVLANFTARVLSSVAPVPAGWRRLCAPLLRAHAAGRDWVEWRLPWWRKRLERDFSVLLAILLDSGMPEERAVTLAADGTANGRFRARAAAVVAELRRGVKLTEAVAGMDDTGEFRWRLANAAAGPAQFVAALTGWHETLEARAFRQEQAVSQTASSALLLVNGLFVGTLAVGIFQALIVMMNMVEGLW